MARRRAVALLAAAVLLHSPCTAQPLPPLLDEPLPAVVNICVQAFTPFVMRRDWLGHTLTELAFPPGFEEAHSLTGILFQGVNVSKLDGFDVAFTRLLVETYLGAAVAYIPYPDTSSMLAGLRNGECDMAASALELNAGHKRCGRDCPDPTVAPIPVFPASDYTDYAYQSRRVQACCLDYSLSYLPSSGFALFSLTQAGDVSLVSAILSFEVLNAATPVFIALICFGWLIFFVERKNNKQFDSPLAAQYFAFVSMATFGFGDVAPLTRAGRVLTILWAITSVLSLAAFTSVVSARLTVGQLGVHTFDSLLQVNPSNVCVEAAYPAAQQLVSEAFALGGDLRSAGVMLATEEHCALAVINGSALVYVADQPVLRWLAYSFYASSASLYVSPVIRGNPFSFAYPAGSPLRSVIDAALIDFTTNTTWLTAANNLQALWFPTLPPVAPPTTTSITKPTFIAAIVLVGGSILIDAAYWAVSERRTADSNGGEKGEVDGGLDYAQGGATGAALALREAERATRAAADAVAAVHLAAEAATAAASAAAALARLQPRPSSSKLATMPPVSRDQISEMQL